MNEKHQVNWKRISIGLTLIVFLLAGTIAYVHSIGSVSTQYLSGGIYSGAPAYTVWVEGSSYFAKDANGYIPYSSSNCSYVLQSVINAITSGGRIYLKVGVYVLLVPIIITEANPAIIIDGEGYSRAEDYGTTIRPPPGNYAFIVNGSSTTYADTVHHVEIKNLRIALTTYGVACDGIYVGNSQGVLLENLWIWNLNGTGLYITQVAEGKFEQLDIRFCGSTVTTKSSVEIIGDGYTNHLMFTRLWIAQFYYYGLYVHNIYYMGMPQCISIIEGFIHGSNSVAEYGMLSSYAAVRLRGVNDFQISDVVFTSVDNDTTLLEIFDGIGSPVTPTMHVDVTRCRFQLAGYAINTSGRMVDIHDNYIQMLNKGGIITNGDGDNHNIHDNWFAWAAFDADNTRNWVTLGSDYNLIHGNYFWNWGEPNHAKYCIQELATHNFNKVDLNNLYDGDTATVVLVGVNSTATNNNGYP